MLWQYFLHAVCLFMIASFPQRAHCGSYDSKAGHNVEPIPLSAEACSQHLSNQPEHWTLVNNTDGFPQYVWKSGLDVVSNTILSTGGWEQREAIELEWALSQLNASIHADGNPDGFQAMLMDIGSNIGTFTLRFAKRGYKVLAFEPMKDNALMTQASLCLDREYAGRVTLLNMGLSSKQTVCMVLSEDDNRGDGGTVCTNSVSAASRKLQSRGLLDGKMRNQMVVDRLDAVLFRLHHERYINMHKAKFVMKIDVEGHEFEALLGGVKVLAERSVPYILAEYFPALLLSSSYSQEAVDTYLYLVYGLGYDMSTESFKGPFVLPGDIAGSVKKSGAYVNLYLVLRKPYHAHVPFA